jgi:sulfate adenylyltransferase subunit 2
MNSLDRLESQSIHILREAFAAFNPLGMLWSAGKDSNVILWLARKAFFGAVPFPLIYIDTQFDMPELLRFRDQLIADWQLNVIVSVNRAALEQGRTFPDGKLSRVECCGTLKKDALKQTLETHKFEGLIVGVRRDEEPTRAKERVFSPRDAAMQWAVEDQPPELWDQYNTQVPAGSHVRVHPLLHWTESNIWEYTLREGIPVPALYFNRGEGRRFRSLGCHTCTFNSPSAAATIPEIIEELRKSRVSERAGRAHDHESEDAFERLRRDGFM